jgi:hypothetical protein
MYLEDLLKLLREKLNYGSNIKIKYRENEAIVYIDGEYFSTYDVS